jgi:hypothetical protein
LAYYLGFNIAYFCISSTILKDNRSLIGLV